MPESIRQLSLFCSDGWERIIMRDHKDDDTDKKFYQQKLKTMKNFFLDSDHGGQSSSPTAYIKYQIPDTLSLIKNH